MTIEKILVMIILGIMVGLFVMRAIKGKKIHDVVVLVILIICIFIRLPIGESIPKSAVITISLGLAVVAVLSYLKSKSDKVKKELQDKNSSEENL